MSYKNITVPANGKAITIKDNSLKVPNKPIIGYIEGDGIGVDISPVMLNALEHFNTSIEDVLELDLSSENPLEYIQKNNGKQKIFQKLDSGSPLFIASANLIKSMTYAPI